MKGKKILRALMAAAAAFLGAAVFFAVAAMTGGDGDELWASRTREQPAPQVVPSAVSDPAAAESLFGAPLPVPAGAVLTGGKIYNADHGALRCLLAELRFDNGLRVTAVRPASGAPLLLPEGMRVQSGIGEVSVYGCSCMLMSGKAGCCACFSDEEVSWCVISEEPDPEELIRQLEKME